MSRRKPLKCTLCGAAMWNDETVTWSPEPDRQPFCSEGCYRLAYAEYTFDREGKTT